MSIAATIAIDLGLVIGFGVLLSALVNLLLFHVPNARKDAK